MSVFFRLFGARFSEFSPQGNPSVCHGRQLPLHRGAMGLRCPPGVDRLVFGLIGRRCFGGRGELRSPLSPHRNALFGHSGVPHGLFMISHHRPCGRWCFARLIRQAETLELQLHSQPPSKRTALSELKRSCFRFAPLTLRWAGGASLPPAPPSPAPADFRKTDRHSLWVIFC